MLEQQELLAIADVRLGEHFNRLVQVLLHFRVLWRNDAIDLDYHSLASFELEQNVRVAHKQHLPDFVLLLMRNNVDPSSAHSRLNDEAELAVVSLGDHNDVVRFWHVLNVLN